LSKSYGRGPANRTQYLLCPRQTDSQFPSPRKNVSAKTKPARSFDLAGMKSNYSKSAQAPGRASVLTDLWVIMGSAPKWSFCVTQ
jgi:hypothetical protein